MKKLRNIACIVFFIGLTFLFLHLPGAAILTITGILALLSYSIVYLINNGKNDLKKSLVILSITLWTVYFVFRILYLPGGPYILGFALIFFIPLLVTIVSLVFVLSSKQKISLIEMFLVVYFIFSFWLGSVRSNRIYYFLNLNEVTFKTTREERFQAWDRYSWFLYLADKKEEALDANLKAQEILDRILQSNQNQYLIDCLENIQAHRKLIESNNWTQD